MRSDSERRAPRRGGAGSGGTDYRRSIHACDQRLHVRAIIVRSYFLQLLLLS